LPFNIVRTVPKPHDGFSEFMHVLASPAEIDAAMTPHAPSTTVFISGVAGFLGSHLADHFLAQGHRVVGCDNLLGGTIDNVPSGVEFHRADCNDLEAMLAITREVDLVYHAAAAPYEGMSVFSPNLVTRHVVGATVGLATAAIQNRARRFVLCSSMARYGANEIPFTETLSPKPQDPYGIGKLAAEHLVANLCGVHGIEHAIAVPHNIIGPRQKYDDPYRNVASIMINLMLQGRQPIIYGDGSQRRCFSDVRDVVPVLARLGVDPDVRGEVFNVGPDEEVVTISELAGRIARLIGFELDPVFVPSRPQEVTVATCSADKARARLGYVTRHSLDDALQSIIDHVRARGTRPFQYHLPLEIVNERTPETWLRRLF
jgi:UDP-glucose 4-epimerase